ncbi:MAG: NFYB/HAP3 family transcription factor subunit [Candidatus Aenigmarchaeota archaeon]|nr:NFYB/HAP3 family transcription factor subunit [Candidatus Aenigmarchaeota archaeon]
MELTLEPVRRLFKRAGAKRVSDKAALELARVLEERTRLVAEEARKLSEHSERRTVMKRDIRLAKKILEKH